MALPQIDGGFLDSDSDAGDLPVESTPDTYIAAQDALIAAIQADGGLVLAEVNRYLPLVESTLTNVASAFPGAGTLVSALLKVIPKTIP